MILASIESFIGSIWFGVMMFFVGVIAYPLVGKLVKWIGSKIPG